MEAFVSGRVQGVFFRASTRRKAKQWDLGGWVKNLPDGRVQVVAEGDPADLDEFESWLHEGPRLANVRAVDVEKEAIEARKYSTFRVRR